MKVVFVVGPTASGKSSLAVALAQKFSGAILNADSVQVYQQLLIGSAAPTQKEKQLVPHFFFQEIAPPARITAGDFARRAHEHLKNLSEKFSVVFVVGGTGFYLQALEKGMLPIEKADALLQMQIESELTEPEGEEKLFAELTLRDPLAATRISKHDHYRLVRAIEIMRRRGVSLSQIESEHEAQAKPFAYPLLKIGLKIDRELLRERVHLRTKQMLQAGLVSEVQSLIDEGYSDWPPLQSVGYVETLRYLQKDSEIQDLAQLEKLIVQNTMRLAKKQRTWFQRDQAIVWSDFTNQDFCFEQVTKFLEII